MATAQAWCPGCRAELPQEYLSSPVMGCPRCRRVIHFPDYRTPHPSTFDRFDRAARRAAARLSREWSEGDSKTRSEVEKKIGALAQLLENL